MHRPILALSLIFATTLSATAQQVSPAPGKSDWARVQSISPENDLRVKTPTASNYCELKSVDAETLTCTRDGQDLVFKRAEVKSVKVSHRMRSTWIGVGIGYLGTVLIGAAAYHGNYESFQAGAVIWLLSLVVAGLGAIVGHFSDFTGHTVYQVP